MRIASCFFFVGRRWFPRRTNQIRFPAFHHQTWISCTYNIESCQWRIVSIFAGFLAISRDIPKQSEHYVPLKHHNYVRCSVSISTRNPPMSKSGPDPMFANPETNHCLLYIGKQCWKSIASGSIWWSNSTKFLLRNYWQPAVSQTTPDLNTRVYPVTNEFGSYENANVFDSFFDCVVFGHRHGWSGFKMVSEPCLIYKTIMRTKRLKIGIRQLQIFERQRFEICIDVSIGKLGRNIFKFVKETTRVYCE